MSARQWDLYAAERRAGHVLFIAGLWVVRAYILTKYRAGDTADDVRYALAQRRGSRLARKMLRDGTLDAKSPRKVIEVPR